MTTEPRDTSSMEIGAASGGPGGPAGEPDGFQAFYQASHGQLVAHLYALTGDLGEAQDAAQEAFVRAWNHWPRLSTYDNPVAWVRLTGQRIAISRWRRARTALRSWTRHGPANPTPGPGPESVALVAALRVLPETQRRAVVLHHMGGLTVAEIAAEEGVALGTIKARLHRGRSALAELLGEPAVEETESAAGGSLVGGASGRPHRPNRSDPSDHSDRSDHLAPQAVDATSAPATLTTKLATKTKGKAKSRV